MSEELHDEITSINSIYGDDTLCSLEKNSNVYILVLPSQPSISLRIEFPFDYPDAPPSIIGTQSIGNDTAKGEGAQLVDLVRTTLSQVYTPGSPCVFDLIEECGQSLQQLDPDHNTKDAEQQAVQANNQSRHARGLDDGVSDDYQQALEIGDAPPWALSEAITEKKSVFVARSAHVTSVDQAKAYLAHLLATDKKAAKATHNITAWRIKGENSVQYQDCDDDGETAAGGRVLHLLELMNVWNAMVVVTRWYGGVHLGPDRFRIINQCARDAIVRGGLAALDDSKSTGKGKVKK